MSLNIAVVGAGAIGLSSAVRIIEAYPTAEVHLIADKFTPFTTSDIAAGYWAPVFMSNTPLDLQRRWGVDTYKYLRQCIDTKQTSETGIFYTTSFTLEPHDDIEIPTWSTDVLDFRKLKTAELERFPGAKDGFSFTSVVCEGSKFLPWLAERFKSLGGKIHSRRIKSFSELAGDYDVVVNCTGLGANQLVGSNEVFPIRGHILRVKAPWIKFCVILLVDPPVYVLVNNDSVIVGGTSTKGDWNIAPDPEDGQAIMKKAIKFIPSLANGQVLGQTVGLRPGRDCVRLEAEDKQYGHHKLRIIHNYGHGGGGLTLFWGCAGDVTKLVQDYIQGQRHFKAKL